MKTPKKPTDPVTLGIGQGFRWLASLNPLEPDKLFASVSIGKNSGSFSDDNWDSLEPFAAEFSPDRNAVIVIRRTEKDGSQTLAGMLCRDGEWMQAPASLLLEVNQLSPDLKKRPVTTNLRCADITSIYPDCPATVLTGEGAPQEDEDEEEEGDHNPTFDPIPKGAVTHSPSTDAQIAERGRISVEIDDIFDWLSTLDAAKDNLYCGIYTGYTEACYFKANWDAIAYADCTAISADVVLEKQETLPDGTKKSILMGLAHYGKKWKNLTQEEIEDLIDDHPEAFDWVANVPNPSYANIKDIYPSCPIPDEMPAAETEAAVASEKTKKTKGRSGVAHEIERIFSWLATLDAVHGDLFCTAEVGREKGFFWSANWHELLHFNPGAGDTATFVLLKREKTENGGKRDLLMGMKYGGKSWEVMTRGDLHELADQNSSFGHFINAATNAMCNSIKDIYPNCPI